MSVPKTVMALLVAFGLAGQAGHALAAQLTVTSYDTPNGDGQAHSGSYNYWDRNYTGSGSTITDGAALSGGLGKLTDGVVASAIWSFVSNAAGTGEYVGWRHLGVADPKLTFHFAGSPTINDIKIQLDNSNFGGVIAPSAVWIDGVNAAFTAPTPGTVGTVDFSGLNLVGGTHTIQFFQDIKYYPGNPDSWTFVSEVSFFGGAGGVPEPTTWALMIGGFGLVGASRRRRRMPA